MIRQLLSEITRERFTEYMQGITRNLHLSFKEVFRRRLIGLHFLGIILSLPIIVLRIDWQYYGFFKNHLWLQFFFFIGPPLGAFVPLFFPASLYLYGKRENKPYLSPIAYVITQAGLVALFWSSLYKAITGRTGPELFEDHSGDYSREFSFGFLRKGVFDGWPSGHTSISWAMVIAFWICLPRILRYYSVDNQDPTARKLMTIRKLGILYAIYISIAVSTNIHWFSDIVMGIFVGVASGLATSKIFLVDTNYMHLEIQSSQRLRIFWGIILAIIFFSFLGADDLIRLYKSQ